MRYESFLDYLGDLRAPEAPEIPPGGTTGDDIADARLCDYAFKAKNHSDPIGYLRDIAGVLFGRAACGSWQDKAFDRISAWTVEHQKDRTDD